MQGTPVAVISEHSMLTRECDQAGRCAIPLVELCVPLLFGRSHPVACDRLGGDDNFANLQRPQVDAGVASDRAKSIDVEWRSDQHGRTVIVHGVDLGAGRQISDAEHLGADAAIGIDMLHPAARHPDRKRHRNNIFCSNSHAPKRNTPSAQRLGIVIAADAMRFFSHLGGTARIRLRRQSLRSASCTASQTAEHTAGRRSDLLSSRKRAAPIAARRVLSLRRSNSFARAAGGRKDFAWMRRSKAARPSANCRSRPASRIAGRAISLRYSGRYSGSGLRT